MVVEECKSDSEVRLIPYEDVYPDSGFEDMLRRVPSIERIKDLIGWVPEYGLRDIIRYVRDYELGERARPGGSA